ncbi:hypothetical protein M9435_001540 [Picochlorum sp. BPE23]|nr:hypothetical protein M9435_001540 [Picochlorum sp. BPE23]
MSVQRRDADLEDSFSDSSVRKNHTSRYLLTRRDALECLVRERKVGERKARQAARMGGAQVILDSDVSSSSSSSFEEADSCKKNKKKKGFLRGKTPGRATKEGQGLVRYQSQYYTNDKGDDMSVSSGLDDFIATSSSSSPSQSHSNDNKEEDSKNSRESTPERRRSSRKRKSILVDSSSSSSEKDDDEKIANKDSESEDDDVVLTPCDGGKQGGREKKVLGHGRRRTPLWRAKDKQRMSPIDRIRKAQDEILEDDESSVSRDDVSSSSLSPRPSGDEVVCLLTDEGDPGTTDEEYSSPSSLDNRKAHTPQAWEIEVQKLGIHKLTEREYLEAYIEYLFICSVDPSYEQTVKESESHASLYSAAIRKIEYMILHAQDAVHSEIWRKCDPYLLEAVEQHEIVHIESCVEDGIQEPGDGYECSACRKFNGHKLIRFEGKIEDDGMMVGERDADMMLSQKYALASPVYQRNRKWIMQESLTNQMMSPTTTFYVGSICGHRLVVFHGLFHFRHHCIKYLTLQAKQCLKQHASDGTTLDKNSLIDSVLTPHAHSKIHSCFIELINIAESYNIQGGEEENEETSNANKRGRSTFSYVSYPSLQDDLVNHQGPVSPIRMDVDNDDGPSSASEDLQ